MNWGVETYALIAFLHRPSGEGTVLMLQGSDLAAMQAGCELLADEARLRALYQRLNVRPKGPLPDFEILLRAKVLQASVLDYEVVAHRRPRG